MTSKSELERRAFFAEGDAKAYRKSYTEKSEQWLAALAERDAFKRENEELAKYVETHAEHLHTLQHLLEDILTLEPQLKHYLTDGDWDVERINRAAEHLRGEDALASLGYTDQCVKFPDNVTPLFPPTPGRGAA